ncbi:Hsp20/alpha crystallin family protein [Polluticoccus soli]|uniref:Hsp20/alpha crystallin family protein n=1 Tax=Polluticoccus soli TaxID=3034150 RepID=UPI0023E13592|nr:Hsp20/alpha crystallin family protein [Flavipsychrobacter sp. JY13-12]
MKRDLEKSGKQKGLFDPFRDFFDFDNLMPTWGRRGNDMPAVNVAEDDKSYTVDVVAPGFKKEDFHVDVENDMLTISAETHSEPTIETKSNNRHYTRREYNYSSFTRSFRLPDNAKDDKISARYENGVLKLDIPKSEEQSRTSKDIPIR